MGILMCWCWLMMPGDKLPAELAACASAYQPHGHEALWGCLVPYLRSDADAVVAVFAAKVDEYPQDPWLWFYLGLAERMARQEDWTFATLRAAELAVPRGESTCGVLSRVLLIDTFLTKGQLAEARHQLDRLLDLDDGLASSRLEAGLVRVRFLIEAEGDLEGAERVLVAIHPEILEAGSATHRSKWFLYSGYVAFRLGDYSAARTAWLHYEELAIKTSGKARLFNARINLLVCDLNLRKGSQAQFRQRALALWEEMEAAGYYDPSLLLLRYKLGDPTGGEVVLSRGLAEARDQESPLWESLFLAAGANQSANQDPARARKYLEEVDQLIESNPLQWLGSICASEFLQALWQVEPPAEAVPRATRLLQQNEQAGKASMGDMSRIMLLSDWTESYYWLAGQLLSRAPDRASLEAAFDILERKRARVLMEQLNRTHEPPINARLEAERRDLRQKISQLQKQLQVANPAEAATGQDELHRLELAEQSLNSRILEASGKDFQRTMPEFSKLAQVQSLLGADEALVTFQLEYDTDLYGNPAGGSWVWKITATSVDVFPIPSRGPLENAVNTYLGLFENETPAEIRDSGSASLYQALFAKILRPKSNLKRLILIPDGVLQRIPFGLLRATPEAEPIATSLELCLVPSASLWVHWRTTEKPLAKGVLVFADPELPAPGLAATGSLVKGLSPLAYAAAEGQMILKALDQSTTLLQGAAASEAALKSQDLAPVGCLHFAAHAVVDATHPDRSAVVLGQSRADDGLLQPREIADLDLTGKMVVLSTCRSAAGKVWRGEGVVSLSRAFIGAGATTVVGTLRPLPDDQAAQFFKTFYRSLAAGASTASALQQAQVHGMATGMDPAVWSSVILIGDGAFRPFPAGLPQNPYWLAALLAVCLLLLIGGWWIRRFRRGP